MNRCFNKQNLQKVFGVLIMFEKDTYYIKLKSNGKISKVSKKLFSHLQFDYRFEIPSLLEISTFEMINIKNKINKNLSFYS